MEEKDTALRRVFFRFRVESAEVFDGAENGGTGG